MAGEIILVLIGMFLGWLLTWMHYDGAVAKAEDAGLDAGYNDGYEESRIQTLLEVEGALVGTKDHRPLPMTEHTLFQVWEYAQLAAAVQAARLKLVHDANGDTVTAQDVVDEAAAHYI